MLAFLRTARFLMFPLLFSPCACSNHSPSHASLVDGAYATAGIVPVKPYTRSIYNTNDF